MSEMGLQEKIVREVAVLPSRAWDKITVNIEIDDIDGERVMSPDADCWLNECSEQM